MFYSAFLAIYGVDPNLCALASSKGMQSFGVPTLGHPTQGWDGVSEPEDSFSPRSAQKHGVIG